MDSVFGLADDVYGGLASVRPKLSQHQLEQVNAILVHSLYTAGSLSGIAPAVNDSFLRNACTELWARIAQDSGVRAPWVGLVVRILSALCLKAGLDRVLFLIHIWRIIAQPSEELCSGMGRAIMQTSLESTFGKDVTQAGESLGPLAGGDLKLLMDWVFYTLQKDGHVPSPSTSEVNLSIQAQVACELEILIVEEEDTTILPSQSGMLLAIDLGSQILFMVETLDATHCGPDFLEILEAWRWCIHQEVVRLLRGCRLEAVRKHVIVTIAGPLYHGWKHSDALEDLWHLIASPGEGQSVELQLALLCILAQDFMCVLNVPTRHAQGFWNLIHLAISNKSSNLSRRRGLHVLQKLLALADDEGIEDDEDEDDEDDDGDEENSSNNPKASTCPNTESYCPQPQPQPRRIAEWTKDGRSCLKELFCRDALVQWKDYARVMEVLEMETEMHLLDQVIPTVERLCAKLSVNTCCARAHPRVTEFRWLAIPLGLLITTGTIARRRALMSRIITGDLGLGRPCNDSNNNTGNGNGNDRENAGGEDHEDHNRCCALSKVDETWVAQVLVPALDQVGWHSSTSKTSLNVFSRSVRDFLRCFVKTLSVPRMKIFLQLLFKAIRERFIGSTGALFTLLAALDLDGAKIPAMGPKELFQLKDMLMAILPPLNQAKRTLLLDGIVQILEAFTDYKNPGISLSLSVTDLEAHGLREVSSPPALNVIMDIISAIPGDLVTRRYLPQLVSWVSSFPFRRCGTSVAQGFEENQLWLVLFKGRMEAYLMGGRRSDRRQAGGTGGRQVKTSAEGQHLCLLGLVLSEGFASKDKHGEVLTMGLSPLVKVLRKCWNEPYVAEETVQAALTLFSAWIRASGGVSDNEKQRWRRRPLEASVHEVTTYVSVRLTSMIDATYKGKVPHVDGGDAQIVLNALEAAMAGVPGISQNAASRLTLGAGLHPDVLGLRETCVSLLIKCGQCRVTPAAHMLAVASLEIIVRSIVNNVINNGVGVGPEGGGDSYGYGYRHRMERERLGIDGISGISGTLLSCLVLVTPAQGVDVVRSLLHHNVDGRVTSPDGEGLVGQGWADISKQHEQRRWSCLSVLLVAVLGQVRTSDAIERELPLLQEDPEVFNALVEGIRSCSREEMPMAISCFRTSFPWYMQSLYQDQRSSAFMRVFELVWGTIMEARRPQFTLVLDFVSAVLHPVHLAMPELCSSAPTSASQEASLFAESCIVSAFKSIVEFGVSNKPNVMRAVVGRLIELWRQCPGGFFQLVPEMSELLLFKEWGQGIENASNASNRANSATEAPRLMLLLFLEKTVIPSAAKGHQQQESKQMLRALTMVLMDKHNSKEFRQAGITDQVTYGRKLRSWQALCILCGYLCGVSPSPSSSTSITISSSKCTATPTPTASASDDGHTLELIEAVAAWFWRVHGRTSLPAVRQLMEVFAVRMCQAHPDVFVPAAIEQLSDVRLPGQVLCSLLIISGHVLVGKRKEALSSHKHRLNLFKACLPWMVGTHVMGRMIAQLICHSLLPEVLGGIEGTPLENIFSFLDNNADMVVMRERQLEAFGKTDCAAMCTVEGMLEAHGSGTNGEIIPIHMCELLQKMMDDIWNEAQQDKIRALEEGRFWLQTSAKVEKGTWFDEDEALSSGFDDFIHIQQKIIPWDKLDLAVDVARSTSLEQSTAAGRMRQPVVMCATLVDKVPNLAGLARTCEIFAASNLLIPDLGALKNPSFSKISTGAEQWLPVEELREEQLLSWLTRLKKQGYTLVGIEQTNNSVCLTKVKFPRRCVLVLGREHSGLPLRVINEMDLCCQIPQQGVLRSLNAHVSGSLVLWEYTRQMLQIVS